MDFSKGKTSQFKEIPDQEVVLRIIQAQNQKELRLYQAELYQRYAGKIYHKCISLAGDTEVAKDLMHDIFIKIFVNISRYKGDAPFYSWVFAIVYNHCFDYLNKKKRMYSTPISELPNEPADDDWELQHKLFREAQLSSMEAAFEKLKPTEKLLLTMFYQDGLPIKEISSLLQSSESAIKMRLQRSRAHLAELIKKSTHEKDA